MNNYEVLYVIDPAVEDTARADLITRFNDIVAANGGTVVRVDEWGKRRLAYAINYKTEGYYVLLYMTAASDLPRELERNFKINEAILRYMTIRIDGEIPAKREPVKPVFEKAEEQPEVKAEAKAEAAAPAAEAVVEEAPAAEEADTEAPAAEIE